MPDLGGGEADVASEGAMAALYQPRPKFDWASGFTSKNAKDSAANDTCACWPWCFPCAYKQTPWDAGGAVGRGCCLSVVCFPVVRHSDTVLWLSPGLPVIKVSPWSYRDALFFPRWCVSFLLAAGGDVFGEVPRVVKPGAYRCVCVELDIAHLGVNSVLNSAALNDIEGTDFIPDVIESAVESLAGGNGAALFPPVYSAHHVVLLTFVEFGAE